MTGRRDSFLSSFLKTDDYRLEPLHGDGSDRAFSRVTTASGSYILMEHPHGDRENRAFLYIGQHLRERTIRVPNLLAFSGDGLALMEDLGDEHLLIRVSGKDEEVVEQWYRKAIEVLVDMQDKATAGFRTEFCCDSPIYDGRFALAREGRYFLDAFLKGYLNLTNLPAQLEGELEALAAKVDFDWPRVFLHRDFQSRNIMVKNDELYLIDFQGARLGPPHYDLASLVCDPYADLSSPLRERLIGYYLDMRGIADRKGFMEKFLHVGIHRAMQALGAYGFLTRVKGKTFFERHIPAGVRNLGWFARRLDPRDFPVLLRCSREVLSWVEKPKEKERG